MNTWLTAEVKFPVFFSKKIFNSTVMLVFFMALSACSQHKNNYKEISNHGLTIQLAQLPPENRDTAGVCYAARLIPDKKFIKTGDNVLKANLLYRMDSCFYLLNKNKKIFPNLIQPIANGVTGAFDYLLFFDKQDLMTESDMIYKDKYLNHRKYSIRL